MKCPNCGTNLTIDDAKCPFCQQDNPYAKKHRQDMRYFKKKFNQTKNSVLEESKALNANMVKIVTISIVAVLCVISFFFRVNPYSVEKFFTKMSIQAHESEHRERLNQYEAERDYISLGKYYREYSLFRCDDFDEYRRVSYIADYYTDIFKRAFELYDYNQLKEEDSFIQDKDKLIRSISDSLDYMYKYENKSDFDNPDMYKEPHLSCIHDCIKDAEEMLQVYFNLTEKEVASLRTLSQARRAVLIEEAWLKNE